MDADADPPTAENAVPEDSGPGDDGAPQAAPAAPAAPPVRSYPWRRALITGASSGIGRAMARRLGRSGVDLVVVARDRGRLEALAAELMLPKVGGEEAGVDVEVIVADLADPARLAEVERRLADRARPIDLAVNNAGFGTYGDFAGLDLDGETREIAVNVTALVRLTHAALGGMLRRREGAVLNVSSVAGLQATPGNATYGATKAFVASFGEAVYGELAGTGVTLTTVLPGFTRTEFQARAGIAGRQIPGAAWQSAEDVATQALAAAAAGKPWFVPGTLNKFAVAATTPLPRGLRRRVAARAARRL
jgi:short-subunit dehydrogenase